MEGVWRWVLIAAAALTALLLLVARMPPSPPVTLRPLPLGAPASTSDAAPASASASSTAAASVASSRAAASVASSTAAASVTPTTTAAPPKVALAADLYEAGHELAHPELCPALGANVTLLAAIMSAPAHRAARDAIRFTWGHFDRRSDVVVAFWLGAPPAELRDDLLAEDALYGDLVLGHSVDTYSNLTLKTLSILEWTAAYCPHARFLLKTDDDMFINVPRLLDFATASPRASASRTIWGRVLRGAMPQRSPRSKYYMPPEQFPDRFFPDFATGPAYLMTADCVQPLLSTALRSRYLSLEDVFVTGVVAERLGVRRTAAPEFLNRKLSPTPCQLRDAVSLHMVQYREQFDLWRKLMDGAADCSNGTPTLLEFFKKQST